MRAMTRALLVLALAAASCGYTPPAQVNTSAPAYRADLDSCEDTAATAVNARSVKTGLAWFSAPVRRWGQIEDATQSCMAGKGYGRVRWCTPEEARSGHVVATAAGLQCADPPTPQRSAGVSAARPAGTSPPAAAR